MENRTSRPLLVGFVSDFETINEIEEVAKTSGYELRWLERVDFILVGESYIHTRQFGEHVSGPVAKLIDLITRLRPGLIIFDLDHTDIPWDHWLSILKSVPATRRYPVLCFGSMAGLERIENAKRSGANIILKREEFLENMASYLGEWVKIPDYLAMDEACNEPLSNLAKKGIELFNQRQFYEAHEVLEEAWNEDGTMGRELYRAILQVAVAYLQIERQNYSGAIKMFWRVRQWIEPLPGICRSVDIDQLRFDSDRVYNVLLQLGPERIGEFDRSLFTGVKIVV